MSRKIIKCLYPTAGYGTRFLTATKEMLPILTKPLLQYSVEIKITDALLTLAKEGKVLAYKFDGKRFDCGFVEATNYFYNKR